MRWIVFYLDLLTGSLCYSPFEVYDDARQFMDKQRKAGGEYRVIAVSGNYSID